MKICDNCGELFTPNRDWQKFCKPECHSEFWRKARAQAAQMIRAGK